MNERLLQYIWQFRHFSSTDLATTEGELLQIIQPGLLNTNQGPDFLNAKIKSGDTIWAGNIELHIRSSDWAKHKHSGDKNYQNIILHVVWQNDIDLQLPFPTLELESRVSLLLLKKHQELMKANSFIPCDNTIMTAGALVWQSWKERLIAERLQQKAANIYSLLAKNNNHWEETFWLLLARNFGAKVNSVAFEKIAASLSVNILAKHKNQIHHLEALLFGQSGLLEGTFEEDYPVMLQKEYIFYKNKYRLAPIKEALHFLRMRPSNFPTIRLAQLAALISNSNHLFTKIKESNSLEEIKNMLNVTASDFWHYHYTFNEQTTFKKKNLGQQMINNILINTIAPVVFAYGAYHNEAKYKDKALQWLFEISPETNTITKGFTQLNIENKNAFDSQALIQLKKNYCDQKRCLDCAVGNKILRSSDI